ncbi:MAG: hypothetical protein R2744_13000 [Bacteroidales bacterium]
MVDWHEKRLGRGWGQESITEPRTSSEVSEVESLKKSLKEIEKRIKKSEG